jgi:hypothetical protein
LTAGTNVTITNAAGAITIAATGGGSSQWTTSGSNIYYNTGNVGIGASSPTNKLQVISGATSGINVSYDTSGNNRSGAFIWTQGTSSGYYAGGAEQTSFGVYTARDTTASFIELTSGQTRFYGNTGLTSGSTYTATERLRLNTSGTVILQGGSTSATGVGITFPATQSASTNANTLDDYEEGTWTPTIFGSSVSGSHTYSTRYGGYTKIGRLVTLSFMCQLAAKGTIAGDISQSNLPFSTNSDNDVARYGRGNIGFVNLATNWVSLGTTNDTNISSVGLTGIKTAAASLVTLTASDLSDSSLVYGSIVYASN